MSKPVDTWKVEALEPRQRCNFILEVRASSRDLAIKRFYAKAAKMPAHFGPVDESWPIISAEVVEPWTYPDWMTEEPSNDE
ncbi:hypothetical protein SEA_GINGERBUG_24 [Microbacterium phage Gingerbug]|nr:hypothetical protein SEA_GINGERBUG_24 [Microbacterium phage Gingerbug]